MTSIIGALRVSLGLDSSGFSSGLGQATRDLRNFNGAANSASRPTGQFTSQLQNAGYQIQDVAVQITGGTDALRAFGQQLPQLLSGFGVFGVIGGTIAAVGLAVAGSLFKSRTEALTADEAIKGLTEAMSRAKEAGDLLKLSQGELAQQFGSAALGADIAASQARDSIEQTVGMIRGLGKGALEPFTRALEFAQVEADMLADAAGRAREPIVAGVDDVRALGAAFALPEQQARALLGSMDAFQSATTAPALSAALLNIYQMLSDWKLEMGQLPPEAEALRATLSGVVGELGAAVAETNNLSASLSEAGAQAERLLELRRMQRMEDKRENVARDVARDKISDLATTEDSRLSTDRGIDLTYQDRLGLPASDPRSPNHRGYTPPKGRGGGGGGGGGKGKGRSAISEAERELEALKAKAEQVVTATRTPMEAFNLRIVELNELVRAGVLDWDTYSRAVGQAQEDMNAAGETGSQMFATLRDGAADMVAGVIEGTTSIKDAMSSMLAQLSSDLLRSGIGGIFGQIFGGGGGAGGGIFAGIGKAISIPGFANGTNFAPGGLAWVGERGRELVNLPRGSQVIPHAESMEMMRGGGYREQAVRVLVGVDPRDGSLRPYVAGEIDRATPGIQRGAVGAVQTGARKSRKFLGR